MKWESYNLSAKSCDQLHDRYKLTDNVNIKVGTIAMFLVYKH